jgi:twitching motility protein PilT
VSVALRLIPNTIKTFEELSLPPVLETFCQLQQGFFLVVGPVGQGKSTTLAAMVERINQTRTEHIITIEDPIEYTFESKNSVINQREVEIDTKSFHAALRSAFRQDIDVVMVGEMRGPETMSAAVTAAETGHLVLSTLHTNNAAQTIDRIIDTFPEGQQDQIRLQLASSLAGIFSQRLVPRISGGLIPAYELLINNDAVANLIREKRSHEINAVIETGSESGMIDMNRNLADLVRRGEVTPENALARAFNPKTFSRLI